MQKGFIDAVVTRDKLKDTVTKLLKMHGYNPDRRIRKPDIFLIEDGNRRTKS